jgi:FkbM family methyltransferase
MYTVTYKNIKIYFHYVIGDHISNSWRDNKFYEDKLLQKIKSLNLKGVYVDVGSHHGNHSIYFEKFCDSTKVVSIEGNPYNFNYLKKNITENKCNAILYNKIVSSNAGEILTMTRDNINTGSSYVVGFKTDLLANEINNTTDTLDNLLENEKNISIIKMDIENYEYHTLLGAQNIINKHHPVIVIELHKTNPYYKEIINFLDKNKYITDSINYACSPTFIYTYN